MSESEAEEQREDDVDFDFGVDSPAVHAEITRRKSLRGPVELQVRDESGQRTLVVPVNELTWCGNPIPIVLDVEAKTRTRLRNGENPVWFLRLHSHFSEKPADVTFAEFCSRRHPHRVEVQRSQTNPTEAREGDDGPTGLPHPLRIAYERLSTEIGEAIEQYGRNRDFGNAAAVCGVVERFVHELSRVPTWQKELEERVTLVEQECASTSAYNRARQEALRSYTGRPRTPSPAKFAIDDLRQEKSRMPLFLEQVVEDRRRIQAVLDRTLGFSEAAIEAFRRWSDKCVEVQHEAERLEADGCYYLYHVHQAATSSAEERSHTAKAMIAAGGIGGTHLDSMSAAADSLIAWARENPPGATETADMKDVAVLDNDEIAGAQMKDFFVSYNGADQKWAEWIAWRLEEAGYSVVIQAWDFRPGANFVLEMQKAAAGTGKTIAVFSDHYLKAEYTQPEWAAAFTKDSRGQERRLIPVRVSECHAEGLLAPIIYVDLVGLSEEDARIALLGAFSERSKPSEAPAFPGTAAASRPEPPSVTPMKKEYPGETRLASFSNSIAVVNKVVVEVPRPPMSRDERLKIVEHLNSLPAQQFNMLAFALDPPPGLIPPMPAPQADRSHALLSWAESHSGCGLVKVIDFLQKIANPR